MTTFKMKLSEILLHSNDPYERMKFIREGGKKALEYKFGIKKWGGYDDEDCDDMSYAFNIPKNWFVSDTGEQ